MLGFLGPLLGGIGGAVGKIFGKGKIDPTTALLGGMSLLGGDEPQFQERRSFNAPGQIEDPRQSLAAALRATSRLGQGLSERGPARLRSSYVPPPPAPVQIEGLPFQIGGGLGRDPALADPSLLEGRDMRGQMYDPFQSAAPNEFAEAKKKTALRRPR